MTRHSTPALASHPWVRPEHAPYPIADAKVCLGMALSNLGMQVIYAEGNCAPGCPFFARTHDAERPRGCRCRPPRHRRGDSAHSRPAGLGGPAVRPLIVAPQGEARSLAKLKKGGNPHADPGAAPG